MLAYYNALKWDSRFTLLLNATKLWNEKVYVTAEAAKNISYIEKCFKQNLQRIKFATKNSSDTYLYLTSEARGL